MPPCVQVEFECGQQTFDRKCLKSQSQIDVIYSKNQTGVTYVNFESFIIDENVTHRDNSSLHRIRILLFNHVLSASTSYFTPG
jgi:hypothetical protein